jgi:hypothetical protein
MIPTTFILYLKLTRLQNMFYMASHKIAFTVWRHINCTPNSTGITIRQSGRSIDAIQADGTKLPQSAYPEKVDDKYCQLQHQRPSNDIAGSIELRILWSIWPFY